MTTTMHPPRFLAKEVRNDHERLATLITHRVPLDAIDRGFALADDKRSGAIKVSVDVAQKL